MTEKLRIEYTNEDGRVLSYDLNVDNRLGIKVEEYWGFVLEFYAHMGFVTEVKVSVPNHFAHTWSNSGSFEKVKECVYE